MISPTDVASAVPRAHEGSHAVSCVVASQRAKEEPPMNARDLMRSDPRTVTPGMRLLDLDRAFLRDRSSGYPVVEKGRLVGIVTRSDVVRKLAMESCYAGGIADFCREAGWIEADDPAASARTEGAAIGERITSAKVADVMSRPVVTVSPDTPIAEVAQVLVENGIHRVPVAEGDRLLGWITTFDLVACLAAKSPTA
jgi:CBS domain-containing protein